MGSAKWPDCDLMLTLKPNFHHHDPLVYCSLLTGKAERGPYSSFATQVNQSEGPMFFLCVSECIFIATILSKSFILHEPVFSSIRPSAGLYAQ